MVVLKGYFEFVRQERKGWKPLRYAKKKEKGNV